ncbi:MAG: hypothetical protein Q7I98_06195 [Erysipelotrichaceae bacterium]|nr:hypothetical protein [Erysipelotrichaceae bacterium]
MKPLNGLFEQKLKVVNLGLEAFYDDLKSQSVDVVHVDWRPTAGGNEKMQSLLNKLKGNK